MLIALVSNPRPLYMYNLWKNWNAHQKKFCALRARPSPSSIIHIGPPPRLNPASAPDFHTFGTLLRWRRARTCSAGWRRLRLCGRSCRRDVAWVHVSKQPACPVVYICVPCSACIVYTSGPWHCVICARIALWAWLHAVCNIHVLGIPLFIGSPV